MQIVASHNAAATAPFDASLDAPHEAPQRALADGVERARARLGDNAPTGLPAPATRPPATMVLPRFGDADAADDAPPGTAAEQQGDEALERERRRGGGGSGGGGDGPALPPLRDPPATSTARLGAMRNPVVADAETRKLVSSPVLNAVPNPARIPAHNFVRNPAAPLPHDTANRRRTSAYQETHAQASALTAQALLGAAADPMAQPQPAADATPDSGRNATSDAGRSFARHAQAGAAHGPAVNHADDGRVSARNGGAMSNAHDATNGPDYRAAGAAEGTVDRAAEGAVHGAVDGAVDGAADRAADSDQIRLTYRFGAPQDGALVTVQWQRDHLHTSLVARASSADVEQALRSAPLPAKVSDARITLEQRSRRERRAPQRLAAARRLRDDGELA